MCVHMIVLYTHVVKSCMPYTHNLEEDFQANLRKKQ